MFQQYNLLLMILLLSQQMSQQHNIIELKRILQRDWAHLQRLVVTTIYHPGYAWAQALVHLSPATVHH